MRKKKTEYPAYIQKVLGEDVKVGDVVYDSIASEAIVYPFEATSVSKRIGWKVVRLIEKVPADEEDDGYTTAEMHHTEDKSRTMPNVYLYHGNYVAIERREPEVNEWGEVSP